MLINLTWLINMLIVLNLVASRLMSHLILLKTCMSRGDLLVTLDKSC
jgi:hypothetical protein